MTPTNIHQEHESGLGRGEKNYERRKSVGGSQTELPRKQAGKQAASQAAWARARVVHWDDRNGSRSRWLQCPGPVDTEMRIRFPRDAHMAMNVP